MVPSSPLFRISNDDWGKAWTRQYPTPEISLRPDKFIAYVHTRPDNSGCMAGQINEILFEGVSVGA